MASVNGELVASLTSSCGVAAGQVNSALGQPQNLAAPLRFHV